MRSYGSCSHEFLANALQKRGKVRVTAVEYFLEKEEMGEIFNARYVHR